ncbi:MAG: hypothetical protein HYY25_02415 [Candidatus Wallbacteria bacterium]|nr:hypothetical protein [Candidatus Wallbacteria bacterium]
MTLPAPIAGPPAANPMIRQLRARVMTRAWARGEATYRFAVAVPVPRADRMRTP